MLHDVGKIGIPDEIINKKGNAVTATSSNAGVHLTFTSLAKHDPPEVYLALTGDQVAITNIKKEQL